MQTNGNNKPPVTNDTSQYTVDLVYPPCNTKQDNESGSDQWGSKPEIINEN